MHLSAVQSGNSVVLGRKRYAKALACDPRCRASAFAAGRRPRADRRRALANPTKDIRNTRRINAVLLDGRLLQRGDLDALIEDAATAQGQ
jgi:hypothetical protein